MVVTGTFLLTYAVGERNCPSLYENTLLSKTGRPRCVIAENKRVLGRD